MVIYDHDSVKIKDCYLLDKDNRLLLLKIIYDEFETKNIKCTRTIFNLEGELVLHAYLYRFGIEKASTKDADLEYIVDNRWYIKTLTGMFQILGV